MLGSNSAIRTVDPESRAANIQGATFASWSRVVQIISSSGFRLTATALVNAIMLAVVLGPKVIPAGSAESSSPIVSLVSSTRSSQACAAGKAP